MEQVSHVGFDWYLSFNITDQSRNVFNIKHIQLIVTQRSVI